MKKVVFLLLLTIVSVAGFAQNRFWIAAGTSNWNNTANWSAASGGAGGASVPTAGNVAVFNGVVGVGTCQLDIAPSVGGITVNGYNGTIDLKGFNLTTTGNNTFTTGIISNSGAAASVALSTIGITTFNGTTFSADVTGSSGNILFNGSTFSGIVNVTKTNNSNDTGTGNNNFNGAVTLTNSSTSQLLLGNANRDIFNKPLTININNTGAISLTAGGATAHQLNDNVSINYNSTGTVLFGANNGSATLAVGKTLTVASFGGAGCGNLTISHFTATTTAQSITLAGNLTATLTIGAGSTFGGSFTATSPSFNIISSTFSATTTLTKTGSNIDNLTGGNTFTSTTVNNNGTGEFNFANTNPDTFNGNTILNNTSTGRVQVGIGSVGNVFNGSLTMNFGGSSSGNNMIIARNAGCTATINGNVFLNCTNTNAAVGIIIANSGSVTINGNVTVTSTSGAGVLFGNAGGTVTLSNGFSIADGGPGTFTTGALSFIGFTQLGGTAQTVTLTGTSSLILGPNSQFNGNINFVSPQVYLNGTTYNGTTYIEKNGATDNYGNGGNTFSGTTTLVDSGSGLLLTANTTADTFNGDLTLTNSGSNIIYLAHNVTGTNFNGNITFNSTAGNGIYFSNNVTGSSTQAAGKTIFIGGSGFSTGELRLRRFTQNGSTAANLTLSGVASLRVGPTTTFGGNVNFVSPQVYLDGAAFNGTAYIEKNGATNNSGLGGNTFAGVTTLVDSGSGLLLTASTTPDTFNADLTVTNTGGNNIRLADNVPGTTFNGNVTVNSTVGTGISFSNNGGGTSSMAAGKTMFIGGLGFSSGTLLISRFTQNGSAAMNLTLSGTAIITIGPTTTFGGNVNFVSPQVLLNGGTFSGTAYIEKNGANNNAGNGGNTFSAATSLVDSGSGYLLTANASPDTFNGDLTISNSGSNIIYLAHNVPGTNFNGNIIVNSTAGGGIYFSNNATGTSTLAAGKTILVGGSGFTVGELHLFRLTQNGTTAVNLTLTGVAILRPGTGTSFGGNVNFVSPQVYLDGATYNGTAYIEKNGPTDNFANGGNTFNSTSTLVDSGSGYLLTGSVAADTFNGDVTITNSGSNIIYMAYNSAGNSFNGNIIVNEISGIGIFFSNNVAGTSILASGKTISIGATNYLAGELRLARFTQLGSATPQTLTLGGVASLRIGPASTFNSNVTFKSPQLYLDGCTYNGVTYLEKNGASNNTGLGNNIFATTTSLVNSASGVLRTNGSNSFNTVSGTTTLSNSGSADILLEVNTGSTYNGDVTFINTGSSYIRSAYNGITAFNGNLIFNSTNGIGVVFCESLGASATLADLKTVSIGGSGFSLGTLYLQRFTQIGVTPQAMTLTGSAILRIGTGSTFNGNVTFKAPELILDGCNYNGTAYLEKTGGVNDTGLGNNIFASTTTIVNSGSGFLRTNGSNSFNTVSGTTTLSNSGTADLLLELVSGSTYNGDVTMTNSGTSYVRAAFIGTNTFSGNITVNSTSGIGVYFCENVAGTATLASGKSIVTGASGFSVGSLVLQRFTQLGPGAQTLTLTGSSILQIGPTSTFNGNVNFKAPQVLLNGCTYNGITIIEKTGATNNDSNGNNIFNGVTTLTDSGSGWLRMARTALDQFNNDLTLTNTGIAVIYMSDLVAGSLYNGNITVNCTLGAGIYFGNNNGSSTLASGNAISVGAPGFSIGELRLQNFTQLGNTSQTITLTGNADIRVGPSSQFNGNVNFVAPQVYLDGCTYNGTAYIEKNGAGNNQGLGNNTFATTTSLVNSNSGNLRTNGNSTYNGATTLLNSGTGDLLLELTGGSTYNGDVTMTNTGSSYVRAAYTGATFFNGNIIVNSLNATGVFFCENAPGTATLASGKTISVGATGFSAGELRLQRFTQLGATPQSITLTVSAIFRTGPSSTWNGNVTVTSPILFLDGATFNGTANSFTKNGTSTDASVGGNTFNGAATFINSGTGIFRLSNTTGDTYNGTATFVQPSGTLQPAYAGSSIATADVTTNSGAAVIFGVNGGTFTFSGGANQGINKAGAAAPTFVRLIMGKTGGIVTLNTVINITNTATFTTGVISSSAANFMNFAVGSTAAGASNSSYVDGPVQKTGNNAFTFPTGNNGIYRSIAITAPGVITDAFTAQYFKAAQAFGGPSTYAAPLLIVSSCEYWILNRTTGVSNVNVTLSWNSPDCAGPYITNLATLRVARWNLTQWVNQGNGGTTGTTTTGTIITTPAVTSFSPFAVASTSLSNSLPIELINFTAQPLDNAVQLNWTTASELNNDHFTVERSTDGMEFKEVATVKGAGTTSQENQYEYIDTSPGSTQLYYRLKQTDIDGNSTFSDVVRVVMGKVTSLIGFPNPVRIGSTVTFNYTGYYQVYNSMGVIVFKTGSTNKIDSSGLAPGLYIVKSDKGLTQRIVVE